MSISSRAPGNPLPSPMGQAALQYARRGWAVFPCRERDSEPFTNAKGETVVFSAKSPYIGKGYKSATTDEQRICAWWRQHPDALIGLPMGDNGLFALDFDPRVDPDTGEVHSLERLKAELEAQIGIVLPPSLTAITQSDGVHVYFAQPDDGGELIRNRGNLPDHVDVRGKGGYVIAPPSVMAETGARYRWHRGDWREAVPQAPAELVAVLRAPKERKAEAGASVVPVATGAAARPAAFDGVDAAVAERIRKYALSALEGEVRAIRSAGTGKRNDQLNESALKIASLCAAGALDERFARTMVEAAARDNPGRDTDAQLTATIDSGWSAGMDSPRDLEEIAAKARSQSERQQSRSASARAPRPLPPPASGAEQQSFRTGRAERDQLPARGGRGDGDDDGDAPTLLADLSPVEQARLRTAAAAWLAKRIVKVERTPDAVKRMAFSAGRRVGAGLLDVEATFELLWDALNDIAGLTIADIDRAVEDGAARGFDLGPLLLLMRCAAFPLTDMGNAERFNARYGHSFRFTTAKGWLGWDGRRWKVLDQEKDSTPAEVLAAVFDTVRAIQNEGWFVADTGWPFDEVISEKALEDLIETLGGDPRRAGGLDRMVFDGRARGRLSAKLRDWGRTSESAGKLGCIANLARRWLTVPIEDFDCDPLAINVLNGTLRFSRTIDANGKRHATVVRTPHRRADLLTKLAPVDYDPDAPAPLYDSYFEWAQPDPAMRRYLHQWGGYSASGHIGEQKLQLWYGGGGNGKSTIMDLWCHVLGDYAGTIGVETFLDQGIKKRGEQATPDLARLGGVRMLRASEPERGAKLNEALIKAVTGGEPIAVRALHRGFFDLLPSFKLTISFNSKPDIPGTDEGIWRRVRLIPWKSHIDKSKQDDELPDKLKKDAVGVFARLCRGLLDWLENKLVEPEAVATATEAYRDESDPLARFLRMCTEMDPQGRVQSSRLHEVFVAWCKAAGEREWTNKGLSKALIDKGFTKKASDGIQWLGLKMTRSVSDFLDDNGRVRERLPSIDDPPDPAAPGAASPSGDDFISGWDDMPP